MRDLDPRDAQVLEELYGPAPKKPKGKKRWRVAAVVLLAVVCVAGAELLACRFFEPALYEEIVAPVRRAARAAGECAGRAGAAVARSAGEAAGALSSGAAKAGDALSSRAAEVREIYRTWTEERRAPPEEAPELLADETDSVLAQPELAPPKEMLNPLISNLVEREGLFYLTGGSVDVVYYNQTDESRAEQRYGSDRLATHGCGPTAMAMAVSTLSGETVDPEDMAKLCVEQGYWCRSHGSYLAIVPGVAERYGLRCESVDLTALEESDLYNHLSSGGLAVALMTKGHFTKGGHFILLRGETLAGEILVADPASRDRSLIPWDLSLILEELSPSRHDGAPLWLLYPAE